MRLLKKKAHRAPNFKVDLLLATGKREIIEVRSFCKFIFKWEFMCFVLLASLCTGVLTYLIINPPGRIVGFFVLWFVSTVMGVAFYILTLTALASIFHPIAPVVFEPLLVVSTSLFTWPLSISGLSIVGSSLLAQSLYPVELFFLAAVYFEVGALVFYSFLRKRLLAKYPVETQRDAKDDVSFWLAGSRYEIGQFLYAQAENQYVRLFSNEGDVLVSGQIVELERQLEEEKFIRTHRSFLVFSHAIASAEDQTYRGSSLLLTNGFRVPVSRRNLRVVKDRVRERAALR